MNDQEKPIEGQLVTQETQGDYLKMEVPMNVAGERYNQLQEFYKKHLVAGRDYGTVPGIDRPFLHHPGAQNLGMVYGLRPQFRIEDRSNMSVTPAYLDYNVTCELYSQKTGLIRGEGVGNCNSWESKYRYRYKKPVCPTCGEETVIKGKKEFGGGWLCYQRIGGCGEKWKDGDNAIEEQELGKIENIDVADQKNTILKMAKKRAYVDAILTTTAASGIFSQDADIVETAAPTKPEPEKKTEKKPPAKSSKQAPDSPITAKQVSRLYAILFEGASQDEPERDARNEKLKNILSIHGWEGVAQVTAEHYEDICQQAENIKLESLSAETKQASLGEPPF